MKSNIQGKTTGHRGSLGGIIFADLLESPLGKYMRFIQSVEETPLYEERRIQFRKLSRECVSVKDKKASFNVIAEIAKKEEGFSIRYTHPGFNKLYLISKFFAKEVDIDPDFKLLLFRLKRINSRNALTFRIINELVEYQNIFLDTGNPRDLLPYSQRQIADVLNKDQLSSIDTGWISRLVSRLSVITPTGDQIPLKTLLPTKRNIYTKHIKDLLKNEIEDIESGKLRCLLTDEGIGEILEEKFGFKVSKYSIYTCQQDLGIPSAKRRLLGYKYPPISAKFSVLYPLTVKSVLKKAPPSPGVYEFRLKGRGIRYPNGKINVIYIGSTRNIRKRLNDHLRKNSKNIHLRNSLEKFGCYFRYITLSKGWEKEESRLYGLFLNTYGAAPKCNMIKPPEKRS
ncbi:MAG: GIY-YIG nuclease family protein [Candidatus Scalindua sp.]|nr:GIY-YIG nuclease family protein [Candidatus Scalindua sp.]MBT6227480.1 GIY-YIG nuclease family protein [Candidatus Scalindua sp.]